jgi:hypothetical protein
MKTRIKVLLTLIAIGVISNTVWLVTLGNSYSLPVFISGLILLLIDVVMLISIICLIILIINDLVMTNLREVDRKKQNRTCLRARFNL